MYINLMLNYLKSFPTFTHQLPLRLTRFHRVRLFDNHILLPNTFVLPDDYYAVIIGPAHYPDISVGLVPLRQVRVVLIDIQRAK